MQQEYDLVIVGSGLAGNCLALALKDTGLRIAIIEASTREQLHASPAGDRALALAAGTVMMLESLGIWQGISHAATAIKQIHISDRGHFGKTRLSAQKEQVDALGYVITALLFKWIAMRGLTSVIRDMMTLLGLCNLRVVVWMSDFIHGTM